jgi:hypothetical protein
MNSTGRSRKPRMAVCTALQLTQTKKVSRRWTLVVVRLPVEDGQLELSSLLSKHALRQCDCCPALKCKEFFAHFFVLQELEFGLLKWRKHIVSLCEVSHCWVHRPASRNFKASSQHRRSHWIQRDQNSKTYYDDQRQLSARTFALCFL